MRNYKKYLNNSWDNFFKVNQKLKQINSKHLGAFLFTKLYIYKKFLVYN